ncbi:MAG: hypothetical protein J7483_07165 [Novosphingobium sp.]|nr:hypothetical protein [Novosphingobium sp.]
MLAEHADLTLTGLYNLRERLASGASFDMAAQDQRASGRVDIIAALHDQLDAAVAAVYGWPVALADEEVVARLVALNAERAREELSGRIRWLRPDYQLAHSGVEMLLPQPNAVELEAELRVAAAAKPLFPRNAIGQTAAVFESLRDGRVPCRIATQRSWSSGNAAAGRCGKQEHSGGRAALSAQGLRWTVIACAATSMHAGLR